MSDNRLTHDERLRGEIRVNAVSYTHLTLPTTNEV